MKTKLTKEFLIQEYVVKEKNSYIIAKETGWTQSTVCRMLKKFGIPTQSPSRIKYHTLPNQKFGKLTPVKIIKDSRRKTMWQCECECGNFCIVGASDIVSGKHTSCNKCNWWGDIPYCIWTMYKKNPKNYEFTISEEYVKNKFNEQNGKCALSGVELYFATTKRSKSQTTASLDRIDSSKGYIEGNVQWVHKAVNFMKRQLSDDEFIDWCKKVAECQKS